MSLILVQIEEMRRSCGPDEKLGKMWSDSDEVSEFSRLRLDIYSYISVGLITTIIVFACRKTTKFSPNSFDKNNINVVQQALLISDYV